MRLTNTGRGKYHITISNRDPLRLGTLASIIARIVARHGFTRDELIQRLFD